MNSLVYVLLIYLSAINFFAVIVTVYDKRSAVRHRRRIRESTLLLISVLGGALGMYLTMLLIRHKTRHIKFMLGIPLILLAEIFVIYDMVNFLWKIS